MLTQLQLEGILENVSFPGYEWFAIYIDGRLFMYAQFDAKDCKTGMIERQTTRRWYISNEATRSEVVHTALKCVLTSIEHEAREVFRYRGQPIFGPHFDVENLVSLCASGLGDAGGRVHRIKG